MDNVLSVTQLNHQIRLLLEQQVGPICVQGELSNLSQPASGHLYFTLKDAGAQLRCVFFRNRHGPNQSLQNGQQIIARGVLSVYEPRGDYQLMVSAVDDAGIGDLHQLFEALKLKLAGLGLFEPGRKKMLPRFPQCIGVVTSSSGAALRDILTTLGRRFPQALVLVYPSDVQGKAAAPQLIAALTRANQDARCDVIILARGGGSIEDLWAFNDETLAHTISASHIPIVTGIGHETDFTIADFVADWRAATPTAAAETVTPDYTEWVAYLQMMRDRLLILIKRILQHRRLLLQHRIQTLASPERLVANYCQKLDYLERHLLSTIQQSLLIKHQRCQVLLTQLAAKHPSARLTQVGMILARLETRCLQAMRAIFVCYQQRFQAQLTTLNAVSPLATLDRGYALVMHDQHLVMNSHDVAIGDVVRVRLAKSELVCAVTDVSP